MNFGDKGYLVAGTTPAVIWKAYLQFDLASIPDDAAISNARLGLYYHFSAISQAEAIGAYIVQGSWNEGTITWNNQPLVATTPEYICTVPGSPTNDFVYWYIGDLVKGWWDGSIPNYGVMLRGTDEGGGTAMKTFYSSDDVSASQRPVLIITYYKPAP